MFLFIILYLIYDENPVFIMLMLGWIKSYILFCRSPNFGLWHADIRNWCQTNGMQSDLHQTWLNHSSFRTSYQFNHIISLIIFNFTRCLSFLCIYCLTKLSLQFHTVKYVHIWATFSFCIQTNLVQNSGKFWYPCLPLVLLGMLMSWYNEFTMNYYILNIRIQVVNIKHMMNLKKEKVTGKLALFASKLWKHCRIVLIWHIFKNSFQTFFQILIL